MKQAFAFILFVVLAACHGHHVGPGCNTLATVTDLSKENGSGFGFKLENGTILVADQHSSSCNHNSNPLQNFTLTDGMKVQIGYENRGHNGTSTTVSITCIQEISEKTE